MQMACHRQQYRQGSGYECDADGLLIHHIRAQCCEQRHAMMLTIKSAFHVLDLYDATMKSAFYVLDLLQ